jgi:hypothetical protein
MRHRIGLAIVVSFLAAVSGITARADDANTLEDLGNRCQLLRENHDPNPTDGLQLLQSKASIAFISADAEKQRQIRQAVFGCAVELPLQSQLTEQPNQPSSPPSYSRSAYDWSAYQHSSQSSAEQGRLPENRPSWAMDRAGPAKATAAAPTGIAPNRLEPFFPWPPPQPYARDIIPNEAFYRLGARSLGMVSQQILEQLNGKGYSGSSFFSAGDGFALVAHMERIDDVGHPVDESRRWGDIDTASLAAFNLREYCLGLFKRRSGFWRILVFIVSSNDFTTNPNTQATPELVREWQQRGRAALPDLLAVRPFLPSYKVHVLLYLFRKDEGHSPGLVSDASVAAHLRATGLHF